MVENDAWKHKRNWCIPHARGNKIKFHPRWHIDSLNSTKPSCWHLNWMPAPKGKPTVWGWEQADTHGKTHSSAACIEHVQHGTCGTKSEFSIWVSTKRIQGIHSTSGAENRIKVQTPSKTPRRRGEGLARSLGEPLVLALYYKMTTAGHESETCSWFFRTLTTQMQGKPATRQRRSRNPPFFHSFSFFFTFFKKLGSPF